MRCQTIIIHVINTSCMPAGPRGLVVRRDRVAALAHLERCDRGCVCRGVCVKGCQNKQGRRALTENTSDAAPARAARAASAMAGFIGPCAPAGSGLSSRAGASVPVVIGQRHGSQRARAVQTRESALLALINPVEPFLALVHGRTRRKGIIRKPIKDQRRQRQLEAVTRYQLKTWYERCSLLSVRPETGRKHQIRRHY